MRVAPTLLLLLAVGCADNAILEVELALPPASGDVQHVLVQVRSGGTSLEDGWSGGSSVDGLVLGDTSTEQVIGIEADDADEITSPLRMRLRYCTSALCDDPADGAAQEVQVTFERAFYEGRYTQYRLMLPAVGDCDAGCLLELSPIPKCMVRGCRAGSAVLYCDGDGRHFCEQ